MGGIELVEVGPRDGFQSVGPLIPTSRKIAIIEALHASGIRRMEATSFVSAAALPLYASAWTAPFDPADRAPYAIDWSRLLAEGETIAQIDRIVMSAQGASLGISVDIDPPRSPVISTDGTKTQIWFLCDAAKQNDAAFSGEGVQIGLSVLIRTSASPYKQFERTGVLTVRQQ